MYRLGLRARNPARQTIRRASSSPSSTKIPLGIRLQHAASFSFYTTLVMGGVGLTGLVAYYFVHDILLPTSDPMIFNHARKLIEKDVECQKVLGSGKLSAYGQASPNKWTRNRPIASTRGVDARGNEILLMEFHVKGTTDIEGLVRLKMVQSQEKGIVGKYDYQYLVVETPQERVYVIDNSPKELNMKKSVLSNDKGFLGVKWGKN